jgi:gliding motility-associated-like protein
MKNTRSHFAHFILQKNFFAVAFLFAITLQVHSQSISGIINTYTQVTDTDLDSCEVTVASTTGFAVGDKVIIMQMKGASIDTTNTAAFGTITNYNSAGNYELCTIASITGSVISFEMTPVKTYDVTKNVQLIYVPVYTNATITGTLTCTPWDGTIGGVLAFIDNGTTVMNADIDVKHFGFRGTLFQTTGWMSCSASYKEPNTTIEALKGESITNLNWTYTKGTGAPSNGGGGGRTDNGGGGASNFGDGGAGGNLGWTASCNLPAQGGKPLSYNNIDNKIFLGGAGGDAQRSEGPGINFGTSGGGIVIIRANAITGNNFTIFANGKDAVNTIQDGGGGAGAGGAVILDCNTYTNVLNVKTDGGKGGNANTYVPVACSGGGGGGGGALWVSTAALDPNITYTCTGGLGGLSMSTVNGSPGLPGGIITNLVIPESTTPCSFTAPTIVTNVVNILCNGQNTGSASITVTGGNQPYTYLWNTGATSTTITGLAAGTYTCTYTDSLGVSSSVIITVTQPTALSMTFANTNINCFGNCNGISTVSVNGGTTPYTLLWNTIPAQTGITAGSLCAGTYSCTVTDDNGCILIQNTTIIQPTNLTLAIASEPCTDDLPNATAMVIPNGGTPGYSYLWNTVPPQTLSMATGLTPGSYTVNVSDTNNCSASISTSIAICPPDSIFVPNIFSPGGDGLNDVFTIFTEGFRSMNCQIFDRWGVEVYAWSTVNGSWDGIANNGKPASDGVYFYIYQAQKESGENVQGSGFLHLARQGKK